MRRLLLLVAGDRVHQAAPAGVGFERPECPAPSVRAWRGYHEIAVEALPRAEPVGRDLMADRARHAVRRQFVERAAAAPGGCGHGREDLPLPAGRVRDRPGRGRVTRRALVLDVRCPPRMVDGLAPHAGQHVGVAGRVGHDRAPPTGADGNVFAAPGGQVVVAGHTLARRREHPNVDRRVRAWRRRCGRCGGGLRGVGPRRGEQAGDQPPGQRHEARRPGRAE